MLKKIMNNFLLILFGLMLAFCSVELSLLAFPFPKDAIRPNYCAKYDGTAVSRYTYSMSHYAYPPQTDLPNCSSDFLVVNMSDVDGYIGKPDSIGDNRMLVFGDSFAYGFGVKKEQAFASLVGAYNAGLWGNSFPNHARVLERLVQSGKKFNVAIWVVYPPHLITVSEGGWATRLKINDEENPWLYWLAGKYNKTRISNAILATLGWGVNNIDYYSPEWSLYDEHDQYAASGYREFEKSAKEISDIAATYKIKIIPLIIPSKRQLALELNRVKPLFKLGDKLEADLPNKRLSQILNASGFPKYDHILIFDELLKADVNYNWAEFYWKNDAHFNEQGNQFVAQIIQNKITQKDIKNLLNK